YVEKLFSFVNIARNIGIVLIVGLLFTAMFLISNTIKITIVARRKEIEIMRLVGATNTFIRWPFFLEGLWLGILGSIIPIG
ncbi:FtsX-like permease family protein, partial [Bacillus licheniformis]